MKFKLKDIHPNPHRHLESYPIKPEKVAALVASIKQTGFWDNVVARLGPDGVPEIAYGHHRLDAARTALGPNAVIDLIIKDLDDATMIKVMANENMAEWGTSAIVEQETVRSVVEAFAAGKIKLRPPGRSRGDNVVRCAPSFCIGLPDRPGVTGPTPYTPLTVAEFLGWVWIDGRNKPRAAEKVVSALDALALIEEKILDTEDFAELGTTAAEVVVEQTKKRRTAKTPESLAQKKRAASRVGKGVAKRLREGTSSVKAEKEAAAIDVSLTRTRPEPSITKRYDELVQEFLRNLAGTLANHSRLMKGLREVSGNRAEIDPDLIDQLAHHVRQAVDRLTEIANELDDQPVTNVITIQSRGGR